MAGIEALEYDAPNKRTCAMWAACGIQFRANSIEADGLIPLHCHSYAHVSMCVQGWFDVVEITAAGERLEYQIAALGYQSADPAFNPRGYRLVIDAEHQHTFTPRGGPGQILCMWAGE